MPPKEKLSPKDQQLLSEGQSLYEFVQADGWTVIKKKLLKRMAELDSLTSIPRDISREERFLQGEIREGVISLLMDWLKDVEGSAVQHKLNSESLSQIREEELETIFEPPTSD